MEGETFTPIIMSFEDFSQTYPDLTKEELDKVWEYAEHKMADLFMQDYDTIMDAIVEGALQN